MSAFELSPARPGGGEAVWVARAVTARFVDGLPGDVAFRSKLLVREFVDFTVDQPPGSAVACVWLWLGQNERAVRVELRYFHDIFGRMAPSTNAERRARRERALLLAEVLSDRWGRGKHRIWFEIDLPASVWESTDAPVVDPVVARGPTCRIGDAAETVRVSVATLRNWEARYGVVVAARTPSGQRVFSSDEIKRLQRIRAWIDAGFSAGEAHRLLRDQESGGSDTGLASR